MTLYLGIDLGTQSLKAVLLDPQRGVLADAAAPLRMLPGLAAGHAEQDPAEWLAALRVAVPAVLAQVPGAKERVRALGVSGQQHGFVPLDQARQVIRPAKLWNDVSSAPQCAALTQEFGGRQRLFERLGNQIAPGFTAGKIRWLAEQEPRNFARLAHVLLPHDYLNLHLTGELCCEAGDASGTALFDVRQRRFAASVCTAVAPGLPRMLPPLRAPGEPAGRLTPAAAAELGLPVGVLVSHGSGDNMMAAIGAGAVRSGIAVLSLGTSGTVFACAEQPVCDPQGEIAAFCDASGRWLPLGCTMNATVSSEVARKLLGLDLAEFESLIAATPPGAEGVLCLPFFTGERSPDLPLAKGAFLGLTPHNARPPALARAAVEGATYALARLFDRLQALGLAVHEVRLTGGGSQSRTWQQICAAVLGRPVVTGISADAAALGAAIHACWTQRRQHEPGLTLERCARELDLERGLHVLAPDPQWLGIYALRRQAYAKAVAALTPVFGDLA